jgi:hypothetical protein
MTCNGAGKIVRIDPKDGSCKKIIELEATSPASLSFGGPDMKTMLVTFMSGTPGTNENPNGSVGFITFEDKSIQGLPINKLNHNLEIPKATESHAVEIGAQSNVDLVVGKEAETLTK